MIVFPSKDCNLDVDNASHVHGLMTSYVSKG
jgi:hypothetical protein